jgi:RNA polymerase-binding transcription factor DksA
MLNIRQRAEKRMNMASKGDRPVKRDSDRFPTQGAINHVKGSDSGKPTLQSEKPCARAVDELKAELVSAVQSSLDWLAVSRTTDPADSVSALAELTSRNLDLLMNKLGTLEDILHAIREGKGRCLSCGGGIPLDRLDAAACPLYCVVCEEAPATPDKAKKAAGGSY